MPALSKKQQKFMGIVRSIQKGEQPASKFNKDAQDVAKDMKKTDVKKFASTKHKGLPMKKEILGKLKEMIRRELSEYTYGVGDVVKDDNPTCPHYGAQGKVKSVNPKSVVFVVTNKGDNFEPGQELEKSHDQMKKIGESINEMSAKTKKIISKLGKKEKEMFMDMVDMMGFDQVMADYKRDKKAFKQALKDMSESVITEKMSVKSSKDYIDNLTQAIDLIVRQANNLKGALAKHPIKRNVNKLKAVQKLYKKFIAPILVTKDRNLSKDFNFTEIKKKLADGKFKSALEYSIMNRIGGGGYDANSFFMLDDKQRKLKDRIYGELRKIVNVMDKAQLENINEDAVFRFDRDGLSVSVSDTFRNRLLEIHLPAEFFTVYACEDSIDLGVIVSRLREVTKTLKAKDEVTGSFDIEVPNFLILTANGIRRRVRLVNTDLLKSPPPMIYDDFIFTAELAATSVTDFLKAASTFHTVDVSVVKDSFTITSQEGEEEVSMQFQADDVALSLEMSDSLTTHGIADLTKGLNTITDTVTIRGGPTIPISFGWSWGSSSQLTCYVTRWE